MRSKENNILELFYNQPTKHWHFKQIKEQVKLADNKISNWLKRFQKDNLIQRIKPKGKMPYYLANYEHPHCQNKKTLYAKQLLFTSGLLDKLKQLDAIVIIFGSFSSWYWHEDSDIDIFICGKADFNKTLYEKKLKREIDTFQCKNPEKFQHLLVNILKGDLIRGDIEPLCQSIKIA